MKLLGLLGATAALALATPADAALFTFAITGDYNATFKLDSSPTPDFADDGGALPYFAIVGVSGIPNASAGIADITFFKGAFGGLLISEGFDYLFDAASVQLYTGSEFSPTFKTGTFALEGLSTRGDYILTITAVPEPASWALMIGGFALTGAAMRRSRKTASVRVQSA